MTHMKVILLILDGWGVSLREVGNAIAQAKLPTFQYIETHYPFCLLKASGISVGLPWAEPGNSEVGHLTLGAGSVTLQAMPRIIETIRDGSFFKNEPLLKAIDNVKTYNSQLHLMGLLGTGSVHSYIDHLYGLLELAQRHGITSQVKLHLFMDGKDSPPYEGAKVVAHLKTRLDQTKQGQIASLVGRSYAMDRDYNWARTEASVNLFIKGKGEKVFDEVGALKEYYRKGMTDSDIPPTLIMADGNTPKGLVSPHDSVIFFNYREDSIRQLTKAFVLPQKVAFSPEVPQGLVVVTMTEYDKDFPSQSAFKPIVLTHTLPQVLSEHQKTQFHIAETQKYAHITYFFNGMREEKYPGEDWRLVPSFDTVDFITRPELKAPEITQALIDALEEDRYDFLLANFANPDLLSHTGNLAATIKACEVIDNAIKEILDTLETYSPKKDFALLITSDHGHAEMMIDPISGSVLTEHTSNDVPFYLIAPRLKKEVSPLGVFSRKRFAWGILADVAPTILELLDIPKPQEMNGKSLVNQLASPL